MENGNAKTGGNAGSEVDVGKVQEEATDEAYFFHPLEVSEGEETRNIEEIEKHKADLEQKLQELLRSISEETMQLSEFLMEEDRLIKELCNSLKQVLKKLKVSFYIPPREIPIRGKVKKVILNDECHLILVYEKGEVHSAFLAEYSPEIVMATLLVIMPELAEALMLYRKRISTRVNLFGRIKKELKNIVKAIVGSQENTEAEKGSMDAVKNALNTGGQSA
ncbi:MAG: hypothetical protein RMJ03_04655 [Nitrososphaerota archaeon]|nr:hypothetical protein [Nitrososphaerota archaeon]